MRALGRPILGGVAGFFFGLSIAILLLVFGVVALASKLVVALPVLFLVLGVVWAYLAPLGSHTPPPGARPLRR